MAISLSAGFIWLVYQYSCTEFEFIGAQPCCFTVYPWKLENCWLAKPHVQKLYMLFSKLRHIFQLLSQAKQDQEMFLQLPITQKDWKITQRMYHFRWKLTNICGSWLNCYVKIILCLTILIRSTALLLVITTTQTRTSQVIVFATGFPISHNGNVK